MPPHAHPPHRKIQEERAASLHAQLEHASSKLASSAADAATRGVSLAAERARADALQRQLGGAVAERRELAARLAAAQIEAAGSVEVCPTLVLYVNEEIRFDRCLVAAYTCLTDRRSFL